jgi:hypothetical protein
MRTSLLASAWRMGDVFEVSYNPLYLLAVRGVKDVNPHEPA